jgi:hypothetical protein
MASGYLHPWTMRTSERGKMRRTLSACTLNVKAKDAKGRDLGPLPLGSVRYQIHPRNVHLQLTPCGWGSNPAVPSTRCRWGGGGGGFGGVLSLPDAVLAGRKLDPVAAHNVSINHKSGEKKKVPTIHHKGDKKATQNDVHNEAICPLLWPISSYIQIYLKQSPKGPKIRGHIRQMAVYDRLF